MHLVRAVNLLLTLSQNHKLQVTLDEVQSISLWHDLDDTAILLLLSNCHGLEVLDDLVFSKLVFSPAINSWKVDEEVSATYLEKSSATFFLL